MGKGMTGNRKKTGETGYMEMGSSVCHNNHPCVKPLSLTKHLATLLLPPDIYAPRKLFVPFCGSGSEAIGAMQAGWEEIAGVDNKQEYIEFAQKRMEHWRNQKKECQLHLDISPCYNDISRKKGIENG